MVIKREFLIIINIAALCFPFIPFLGFLPHSDTGFHVFIFSITLLILQKSKIHSYAVIFVLLISVSISFSLSFFQEIEASQLGRFSYGIFIHLMVFLAIQYLAKKNRKLLIKSLYYIYFIYLLGAIFQLVFPEIFKEIFYFVRSSSSRGLTSFASEPSSFALNCFCILLSLKILGMSNKTFVINVFVVIVFSLNSVLFVIVFLAYLVSEILKMNLKRTLIFISTFSFFYLLILDLELFQNLRIFRNINLLFQNPELLLLDSSLNRRLAHIIFPVLGVFHGFYIFPNFSMAYFQDSFISLSNYYPLFESSIGGNIMSGSGQLIINLGILGLGVVFFIIYKILKSSKISNFVKFSTIFVFVNAISMSWASFAILISLIFYFDKKNFYRWS